MARETAWNSWGEWHHVKDLLYCFDDVNNQNEGLRMTKMWKSRIRSGTLPVSVELTSTLVAAHLANLKNQQGTEEQCQLASAMALIRFVNGATDQLQTGIYAESVQTIANKIHIPEWIVDLRHFATHSQLPSLEILQSGIMFALNWLYQSYWEETATKITEIEQTLTKNISNYLSEYVNLMFDIYCEGIFNNNKEKDISNVRRNTQKNLSRCRDISRLVLRVINHGNIPKIIKVFVQRGFIIPSEEQIKVLNLRASIAETLSDEDIEVMKKLGDFWKPIIDAVQIKFPLFMELMMKEILEYCHRNSMDRKNMSSGLITLFLLSTLSHGSHFCMVQFLVRNPSPMSFQILKEILKEPSTFSSEFKEKLEKNLILFEDCVPVLMKPFNIEFDLEKELGADLAVAKYLKMVNSFQVTETNDVKPSFSKWKLLSPQDLRILPAMGEDSTSFSSLSSKDRQTSKSSFQNQKMLDDDTNAEECTSQELTNIIDNLFVDSSILVTDDDSEVESCLTDEYCIVEDRPWDESFVDFDVKHEEQKPKRIVNINDIDVTRIMFF